MPDWDKGVLKVAEGTVLGNPLLEVPEPRLRETGILSVEQLRAFEIRLHKYIGAQVADSINLLSERLVTVDGRTQEQFERIGREAAERGIDQTVRLHAVDQRLGDRITDLTVLSTNWRTRDAERIEEVRVELTRRLDSAMLSLQTQMVATSMASDRRHEAVLFHLAEFKRDMDRRSALGRLRRLKAWLVGLARRVRYGR